MFLALILTGLGTPSPEPGGAGIVDLRTWAIALLFLVIAVGLTWWLRRK